MIKTKEDLDLPIASRPEQVIYDDPVITKIALLGEEYIGMCLSMKIRKGEVVKRSQVLLENKKNPGVVFTTPASGKIAAIHRDEKRILQSVVIAAEGNNEIEFERYAPEALARLSNEEMRRNLIQPGLWVALRTRLFSEIPAVDAEPLTIFVNAMDTNPLAVDPTVITKEVTEDFKHGLLALSHLTECKIHVYKAASTDVPSVNAASIETYKFGGPHPAGLSGMHIHFIEPVGVNKTVWTINH